MSNGTIDDIQFAILHFFYKNRTDGFLPVQLLPHLCSIIKCQDQSLVEDSLQLLADARYIVIQQWRGRDYMWDLYLYKPGGNLKPFIYEYGNFEFKSTALGRKFYEELDRRRFKNLGAPAANAVVRDTIKKLSNILSLDSKDATFASFCIRILEELVRIGIRNYQDSHYLRDHAQRYINENASKTRRDCETHFYQPFLATELQKDEMLAGHIVQGASAIGGYADIMTICQIPIEAKVIYLDDQREKSVLKNLGVGQATQYAALSRLAFLSVLDLQQRPSAADLSNIQNDVEVIPQQQSGGHEIYVVRVQHVCGYAKPSDVK